MLLLFGILLSLGGFVVILLGQGVIGGVPIVLGIAAVAAALLFTAGRSKVQTGENTELSYLEQEMEELEAQVRIEEEQIDDFCTRWGLREGLELTSWLVELQNKRRDYEALLERQKQDGSDEKTARIAALQKDLQQFFAEYGEVPETQNYLAALHELAGKCRQRQLLLVSLQTLLSPARFSDIPVTPSHNPFYDFPVRPTVLPDAPPESAATTQNSLLPVLPALRISVFAVNISFVFPVICPVLHFPASSCNAAR